MPNCDAFARTRLLNSVLLWIKVNNSELVGEEGLKYKKKISLFNGETLMFNRKKKTWK